jgi:hypothetical protein
MAVTHHTWIAWEVADQPGFTNRLLAGPTLPQQRGQSLPTPEHTFEDRLKS